MIQTKKQGAFTLMEVMIAVVVMGILATLAGPQILKKLATIKLNQTKSTMSAIEAALSDYRQDMGPLPQRLDELVVRPTGKGSDRWDGPYIKGAKEIPLDAWNNEFEYNKGQNIKHKDIYKYYEIISYGPTGEEDESDYINIGE